jgi:hypothetical protein
MPGMYNGDVGTTHPHTVEVRPSKPLAHSFIRIMAVSHCASIWLEHIWNEIARRSEVDVLCGYFQSAFAMGERLNSQPSLRGTLSGTWMRTVFTRLNCLTLGSVL